jgi:hypothetical protein
MEISSTRDVFADDDPEFFLGPYRDEGRIGDDRIP